MSVSNKHYEFAERVIRMGVTVEMRDGRLDGPFTGSIRAPNLNPNQIVRVRCEIDEAEYGCEASIGPASTLTIGQALDLALIKLMEGIPDATKPRAPEEEIRA